MIINNPFNGKLNLDVAEYRISNGDYIDALNITRDAEGKGQDIVVSNILGNTLLPYTLPSGTNKIIGFYADKIRNRAYYFLWNSNGYNSILYYDLSNNTIVKVLESKTDSDGIDILTFNPSYKVLSVNLFYRDTEGDILYFNDGLNPPKSINIISDYGTSWKLEYLLIAKAPPVMPPKVTYENDSEVTVNNLRNSLYQFCYRFVYDNNEKSVWSSKSIVPLPQQPTLYLTDPDLSLNSRISISVSTGGEDVKGIELSFRENDNETISDWYLIKQLDKANNDIPIPNNDIYTYKFYNDSIYSVIDVIESSQLQDWVPQKANASELANGNVLLYSGITEGYDKTSMNLYSYTPNADIPVQINFFKDYCGLLFFATCNGTDSGSTGNVLKIYLYGTGTNTNGEVATLNNNVAKYVINVANSSYANIGYTYEGTLLQKTVSGILTAISAGLVANGNNWSQVSLIGNVLTMSNTNNFTLYSSGVRQVTYTSIIDPAPDNTQFANSWDSGYQYGLQYFDGQGRTIGTQTNKLATFNTYLNNGTGFPQTYLEIKNTPPLEARYYQVVRSNNTTYNKRLYWISNAAYRSPLSANDVTSVYDIESYAYLDVSNIVEYNKQFQTTANVVSYSFTPGDRVTFLKRYDATGAPKTIPIIDYEILGLEVSITTVDGIKEGNFVKIKYPKEWVDADPSNFNFDGGYDFQHYEIFLYNYVTNSDQSQKFFYEFGRCFGIGNPGTSSAYHMGLEQTQSPTNPIAVPAIVSGTNGDLFYRKRTVLMSNKWVYSCGNQDLGYTPVLNLAKMNSLAMNLTPFYCADYEVSTQTGGTELVAGAGTAYYPEFTDSGFFYNKTNGIILISIAFDARISADTTVPNNAPAFYMYYVTATEKVIKPILTTKEAGGDGYIYNCDTKIPIPANTKVWIGVDGQDNFVARFDLTFGVVQNKTIEIIESSFNDAYNLIMNSNGRSSVIDENARQVYFPTLIRFSQAYQNNTNINGTNRFYYENFDEYDRSFGDVMRLHVRDRYLKVYQKFKVGNVPILTQIVKDSANNPLQANTDTLINKIQYYSGDYGIGDASTSLAWNNFADYFVDNYRGVVCRLSQNGIEPISIIYSTNAFFTSKLAAYRQTLNNGSTADGAIYTGNPCIYGVFDAYTNKYIIAMEEINRYSDCSYNGGVAVQPNNIVNWINTEYSSGGITVDSDLYINGNLQAGGINASGYIYVNTNSTVIVGQNSGTSTGIVGSYNLVIRNLNTSTNIYNNTVNVIVSSYQSVQSTSFVAQAGVAYRITASSAISSSTTTTVAPTTTTTTTTAAPTTTTTTGSFTSFSLTYSSTAGATACTDYATPTNRNFYYAAGGATLTTGTILYTTSSLTTPVANGYYSNGTNYWNTAASVGNLQNETFCAG